MGICWLYSFIRCFICWFIFSWGWLFSTFPSHILYLFLIYHHDLSVFLWDFEIKILPLSVIGGTNIGTFSKEVFLSADAELLGVGANNIHFVAFLDAILWYHCTSLSYMAATRTRNQFSAITDGSRYFTFRSIWLVSVPATYPIIYNNCTALS